jgi:hypothetical protein
MNIGELIFALGFKSVGKDVVKNFEKQVTNLTNVEADANSTRQQGIKISDTMASKMGQFGQILSNVKFQIAATASALVYFVKSASDAAVQVDKVQALTGLSSGTIQRLGAMAAQTGMNIGDLTGAVQNLQRESVNIQLGRGGNMGAYQFLGIDPHEDPLKILDQVAKKLKTMPIALGTTMARDLGFSDDLIYFLKNADNLAPVSDEVILSDKEIKRLKQFNFYFNRIFDQSKRVMQQFAVVLAPIAEGVLFFFEKMGNMFTGVSQKLAKFSTSVRPYLLPLIVMGAALFAAFMPVTAAFIAIAAVLEDLWTFVNGGDSLFGRMFNWLTDINARLKDLIHFYIQLRKLMTIGDHTEYYDNLEKDMLSGAEEWLKNKKEEAASPEKKEARNQIMRATEKEMGSTNKLLDKGFKNVEFFKEMENFKNKITSPFLKGDKDPKSMSPLNDDKKPKSVMEGLESRNKPLSPIMPIDKTTNNKTSAVSNNINININEAKTPQQTANVLQTKLSDAFWQRQGGLA